MKSRVSLLAAALGVTALAVSAGSAVAATPGGPGQPVTSGGPATIVYHCDRLTGGSVHGSVSVQIVNGIPDPTSIHGTAACVPVVQGVINGGF